MDRTPDQPRARGIDEPRENRPGVPMSAEPATRERTHWGPLPRQQPRKRHPHSTQRDELTPVFGTGPGPRLASGVLRSMAYRMPEHQARRWLLLLAADRVDVLEHRVPELLTGRGWYALADQVRANPAGMLVLAFGVGFALERTRLLQAVGGAAINALFSADDTDELDGYHRSDAEEQLLAWLNDAYAMERAQIPILENHAKDARRLPQVRKRDLRHLDETKRHARDIERCIEEEFGETPSAGKKAIGRITGAMTSIASEPMDDEIVKNFLTDYATEHFEIACYRALIAAAHEAGHAGVARVCEKILDDEEAMAAWLGENLPMAVNDALH
jgi:ferritin-like metal-binding protein YciE